MRSWRPRRALRPPGSPERLPDPKRPQLGERMLDVTFAGVAATLALIAALFVLDRFISRPGHADTVGFREAVLASLFHVGVPPQHQQRLLRSGILEALVKRANPNGCGR
jgi:hypothetical protein